MDPILETRERVVRIEERQQSMLCMLQEHLKRGDQLEARVSFLEGAKDRLLGIIAACGLVLGVLWETIRTKLFGV